MPHPRDHAQATPDKPVIIMADSGEVVTYRQLEERANQLAHLFRQLGLQAGDHIGMMMENNRRFFEIIWAAQRAGIIFTPISTHLIESEVNYILNNCGAKAFLFTARFSTTAATLREKGSSVETFLLLGDEALADAPLANATLADFDLLETLVADMPITPIDDEEQGGVMFYSSGTTGVPKGVFNPPGSKNIYEHSASVLSIGETFKFGPHTRYLSPAPLYHAAPLVYNFVNMVFGGTSIIMKRFDAENALRTIEEFRPNYSQWVPIMFIRMLKLPAAIRNQYDVSSMKLALHAAAPCPIEIKEQMIDWWGPVIFEYYGASEGHGLTAITSEEWLLHKGSVGRAFLGTIHILDENGDELPAGEIGDVYFSGGGQFTYFGEEEKTKQAYSKTGYNTVGDIGWVDEEGYLYLTDRKNFTIISGGVNIYPQEIENCIINHPQVADVAVFGIPHPEFGQEVKAVVQPLNWAEQSPLLANDILEHCHDNLAHIKVPRSLDFMQELPRKDNGKLYKRRLVEQYS
ncbi:MAG: acyl-CoA synthetase [Chloroflexota bacterium]